MSKSQYIDPNKVRALRAKLVRAIKTAEEQIAGCDLLLGEHVPSSLMPAALHFKANYYRHSAEKRLNVSKLIYPIMPRGRFSANDLREVLLKLGTAEAEEIALTPDRLEGWLWQQAIRSKKLKRYDTKPLTYEKIERDNK